MNEKESPTLFEISSVKSYKINYANSPKYTDTIDSIVEKAKENDNLHERLYEDDMLKLILDVDKITQYKPDLTIDEILNNVSLYVGIDKKDFSYSNNPSNVHGSYHVVIPQFCMKSKHQKVFWDIFRMKYDYGEIIDLSIYGSSCWFRLVNQTKECKEKTEHRIIQGVVKDFILKYTDESTLYDFQPSENIIKNKKEKTIKTIKTINNVNIENKNNTENMSDLELHIKFGLEFSIFSKMKGYNVWLNIGIILKNELGDNGLNYFLKISRMYEKYENDQEVEQKYNSFQKKENVLGIGSLIKYYQDADIDIHNLIVKKFKDLKSTNNKENNFLTLEILNKGENDIAQFIATELIQDVKFCNESWFIYIKETGLWRSVKDVNAKITSHIQFKINESLQEFLRIFNKRDLDDEQKKEFNKNKNTYDDFYKLMCKGSVASQIIKYCKTYLYHGGFIEQLDNGLYKMVFKNGIFDLKLKEDQFTYGIKKDDYMTKTIPFDYIKPSDDEIAYVREKIKKICNYNEEHLEYYLSILGYSLTGDSSKEQLFFYHRGQTANNGKSIIFEVLEELMNNYVMKATPDFLDKDKCLKKEIATWKGLKILWVNELSSKKKDENLVKCIGDGTSYKYNKNYAVEAEIMKIQFKLFCVSNYTINIKMDEGVKRRFKLLQHNAQFKDEFKDDDNIKLEYQNDKNLKSDLQGKYKNALIYLLMTYSNDYWINKKLKKYPEEWNEQKKEVCIGNNKLEEWILETFEFNENFSLFKPDLEEMIKCQGFNNVNITDTLAALKKGIKYKSQERITINKIQKKGLFIGIRLKTEQLDTHESVF